MRVKLSYPEAEAMRSLSRIVKSTQLKREPPFKLIDHQPEANKKPEKNPIRINNPRRKQYEDEARHLIDDAIKRAKESIDNAKEEADKIINEAKQEKQNIEKTAFDKGYEEGYKSGQEQGAREQQTIWQEHLQDFHRLRLELHSQNEKFKKYLEKECLNLSIHIAEKILQRKIEEDGLYFVDLIRAGLKKTGDVRDILIRVSEMDFNKVEKSGGFSELETATRRINFLKDPLLESGDCIIEGPHFEIDAGIRTQVEEIATVLKELDVIENEKEQD